MTRQWMPHIARSVPDARVHICMSEDKALRAAQRDGARLGVALPTGWAAYPAGRQLMQRLEGKCLEVIDPWAAARAAALSDQDFPAVWLPVEAQRQTERCGVVFVPALGGWQTDPEVDLVAVSAAMSGALLLIQGGKA